MNKTVYSIHPPKKFSSKKKAFSHVVYHQENGHFITPDEFSGEGINPKNFYNLRDQFSLESILILDRVKNVKNDVCIMDHVNKSEFDFLTGKTPHKDLPAVPDMTHIYHPIGDMEQKVVHTVGPDRFSNAEIDGEIISESVGLIAPVWHYVGVKVFARNFHVED